MKNTPQGVFFLMQTIFGMSTDFWTGTCGRIGVSERDVPVAQRATGWIRNDGIMRKGE